MFGLDKFREYLIEQKFTLNTDNMALKWLLSGSKRNRKLERYKIELSEFDFEV